MPKYPLIILITGLVLTLCRTAVAQLEIPPIATSALPAIDGDLSDWEVLFASPHLTQSHFLSNYGEFQGRVPEEDQKVEVWLGWNDETNLLYLAARVTDNAFGTTPSDDPALVWRSDDMEVYIDADNSGGPYDSANAHAQQYVLNPTGKYQAVLFPLVLQNPPNVVSAIRRAGTVYTYELAIPGWDSIDQNGVGVRHDFQSDQVLGLMIGFADFEGAAEADAGQLHAFNALYGAVNAWRNANRFTAFRLSGGEGVLAPEAQFPRTFSSSGGDPLGGPAVTLVSAQKYATLQEAMDKERALYIPPRPLGGEPYELDKSLVIEGWDEGIIVGSGRHNNSGTRINFKGNHGLRIHNCRRVMLYNLSIEAREIASGGAAVEITGDEPCEIHLLNLTISGPFNGSEDSRLVSVRAPAQVLMQRDYVSGGEIGLELAHPEAEVIVLGGSIGGNKLNIRQLAGHIEVYGTDTGHTQEFQGTTDIELTQASWKPFIIAGCRTEGSQYLLRTPDTAEGIDVIVKACSVPDETHNGFVRYGAAGILTLLGNAAARGKIEVPTGAGHLWSVGNHLGRAYEAGEPYQLNREARGFALADLWQRVPEGEPFSAFITAEELQARNRPVPENVQFLQSGVIVPPLNTPSALQIADVPIIANIAEFLPSIKDYGAKGDGMTDDTEALQRAIDANQGMYSAPTLFFPAGVYHISRPLLLENRSYGGWWVGAGKDLTTITNTAGGGVVRTNGCGYATFQDLSFVAVEGGTEPVFDLFLDRQRNPERQGIQANLFARCRFVGGSIGLSIAQGEFTMGSENMVIDCEFIRCKVGLEVGNFNALNNNVRRCLFQDNEVALSQQAGSFYVFDSRLERSKDTDLWLRTADCFYVQNTTSNSPSLLRTPNTGAVINVVFDNFRYLGERPNDLIEYMAGGSVTFLNSDLGDGTLYASGAIAHKAIVLAGTHYTAANVALAEERAQDFVLNFSSASPPALAPQAQLRASPDRGVAPLRVQLTDASTGEVTSWQWNFGDGQIGSGRYPTHTYTTPGRYTVTLAVSGAGGSSTTTHQIVVTQPQLVRVAIRLAQPIGGGAIVNKQLSVKVGSSLTMVANGFDAAGNPVAITPTWQVVGTIGTINSQSGTFAAGQRAGRRGSIVVRAKGIRDTVQVTLLPGPLTQITITPSTATLRSRQVMPFRAQGVDAYNNPVPLRPLWYTVGEIGTIDKQTGLFTAGTRSGTGYVVAYADSLFGNAQLSGRSKIAVEAELPTSYALLQNYPNPFNAETTISYDLPEIARVRLVIYNLAGQVVRTLVHDYHHPPGRYTAVWNGRDEDGRVVAGGIYLYRLEVVDRGYTQTKRMLLIQ